MPVQDAALSHAGVLGHASPQLLDTLSTTLLYRLSEAERLLAQTSASIDAEACRRYTMLISEILTALQKLRQAAGPGL